MNCLLFIWRAMSALSASDRLAVAPEEAHRAREQCKSQGIESSQDLAFMFLSYEEAIEHWQGLERAAVSCTC